MCCSDQLEIEARRSPARNTDQKFIVVLVLEKCRKVKILENFPSSLSLTNIKKTLSRARVFNNCADDVTLLSNGPF